MPRNSQARHKAFVLGTSTNALGVVRSLGRKGVKVVCVGPDKGVAMHSRFGKSVLSPDPERQEPQLLELLLRLGQQLSRPGILLPTGDAYLHFVSENREALSECFKFALPQKDVMRRLLNKKSQYQLAEKIGIPLPKTFYPVSLQHMREICREISYPVIMKGCHSIVWRRTYCVQKVLVARSDDELLRGYETIAPLGIEPIVQEVILGPDSTHYKICVCMNASSEPLLIFTLRKIRNFPYHFGVGSVVESKWLPEVASLGLKFLTGVGYVGIGSIEFKTDARDGKLKMIELNSRLWQQNILADVCGMNFPYTLYQVLAGDKVEKRSTFREGIKWVSMKMDYASFRQYRRDGQLTFWRWLASLRGEKTFEVFAADDPRPFLRTLVSHANRFWNSHERITPALKQTRRL